METSTRHKRARQAVACAVLEEWTLKRKKSAPQSSASASSSSAVAPTPAPALAAEATPATHLLGSYDGGQWLGTISNLGTTHNAGNCVDLRKLDPHHTLSSS